MNGHNDWPDEAPTDGGESTLQVAAWHLQILLTSLAGFDGKIMFLTALNAAGISALIGLVATSEPSLWLVGFGLVLSGVCVVLGLGSLWAPNARQFPTPEESLRIMSDGPSEMSRTHFFALREAVQQAEPALRRRLLLTRMLLLMTPIALAIAVATALTAAW